MPLEEIEASQIGSEIAIVANNLLGFNQALSYIDPKDRKLIITGREQLKSEGRFHNADILIEILDFRKNNGPYATTYVFYPRVVDILESPMRISGGKTEDKSVNRREASPRDLRNILKVISGINSQ